MKTRLLISIFTLAALSSGLAQVATIDFANLEKAIVQVYLAGKQLDAAAEQLKRQGDPGSIRNIPGAASTIAQLAKDTPGKPYVEVSSTVSGEDGLTHNGNGFYTPVEPEIQLANGQFATRRSEDYRKFAAVQRAATRFDEVSAEGSARRDALRGAQRQTVEGIETATTDAETQKLKGIQAAQATELATIHAQMSEAAIRVLVQHAANEEDRARQEQADLEARSAHLDSGLRKSLEFFYADSRPTLIPNPRARAR
jgi:hypothetical protein